MSSIPSNWRYIMARGPKAAYEKLPFAGRIGSISIVSDAPELRFHDGVTPGGVVIAVDKDTWQRILELNIIRDLPPYTPPQETFAQRLLRKLTGN